VRHGERVDLEIAETEARARFEDLPVGPVAEAGLHGAGGGLVGEDFQVGKFFQPGDAAGMVAMLVGEKDGVDALERFAGGGQQLAQLAQREAGVDQHPRLLGDEQGAVARTAAAENAKPHRHGGVR
jgi:hypothetical protein